MPRVSRRAALTVAGAAVLLPYARPTVVVLGAPAMLELSGAPVATVTWTPTPVPTVNHFTVRIIWNSSGGPAVQTALMAAVPPAIQQAVEAAGGTAQGSGSSTQALLSVSTTLSASALDALIQATLAVTPYTAHGMTFMIGPLLTTITPEP